MKKVSSIFLTVACIAAATIMGACEDGFKEFSNKYPVAFNNQVTASQQLAITMGNPGQYCTIQRRNINGVTKILMTSFKNSDSYVINETQKFFNYGLGGLIVGTNFEETNVAYDLACPNCDRSSKLLTVTSDGYATCKHCKLVYDMNRYGVISSADTTSQKVNTDTSLRGLYRYRIGYNGVIVNVFN